MAASDPGHILMQAPGEDTPISQLDFVFFQIKAPSLQKNLRDYKKGTNTELALAIIVVQHYGVGERKRVCPLFTAIGTPEVRDSDSSPEWSFTRMSL